jgi:carbamoyltransferase
MVILGINGGFRQGYQDASACLIVNGDVLAAVEEERLNRIKFSAGRLPYLSVFEVLKIAKVKFEEIDCIAFHGSTWSDEVQPRLEAYFIQHFGSCPPLTRFHHHDCHAASTYYASAFDKATVITLDNSGDGVSLQVMKGEQGKLELVERFPRPDSLGLFYQLITQYCGFVKDSDEYKLMGLSSYGNRDSFDFSWLIDFKNGKLEINQEYILVPLPGAPSPHKDEMVFSANFIVKMGSSRRIPKSSLTDFYKNVAASAQKHFESILLKIVEHYVNLTGINKVCLAGGSALNCVANQQLMNAPFIEELFVQPASSDAGISLGAAWLSCVHHYIKPKAPQHTYLGSASTNKEIKHILDLSKVAYHFTKHPEVDAAKYLHQNLVIGWFQGQMEFGPRALGSRSILANPTILDVQKVVNEKVKFRECFRPFCPSVIEEDAPLYFIGKQTISPYMTITYDVNTHGINSLPGVVHVDSTSRIQTVNSNQNKLYYDLLVALKKLNGHGVVLNTSFNLSHEPIVSSPRDALASFFASGLDVLILGNYIIEK